MKEESPPIINAAPQPLPTAIDQEPPAVLFAPALDIHESAEGLILEADLPGVAPDQLQLQVQNNVLHILGRVSWPLPADARPLREEVPRGDFYRSFILGEVVDTERIEAEFSDGVLRLTLPRLERTKPRKIEIRTPSKG